MRRGAPIVTPGDGTSPWTITHHTDFARAFTGLIGERRALGEAIHITSDEAPTWNQIAEMMATAARAEARIVHVPSDAIAGLDPAWGSGLLGDRASAMIFDNAKIKDLVPGWVARIPFETGAREIVRWHDADAARRVVDDQMDHAMDRLVEAFRPDRLWS
jgi:nucleoside-diphosphate-sugar epimerase